MKNSKKLNLTPIEDHIAEDFGKVGTPERDAFSINHPRIPSSSEFPVVSLKRARLFS